jgi:hypothetical protein
MRLIQQAAILAALICVIVVTTTAADDAARSFTKTQISDKYYAEGAGYGDFNQDGSQDVVCGPYWFAGPDFQQRHQFYEGKEFPNDQLYSDNFFSFGHDVNGDGWTDVVRISFPGLPAHWFENPRGKAGDWPRHLAVQSVGTESPSFTDLNGDGRPDIICAMLGKLGYSEYDPENPTAAWTFHAITDPGPWAPFTHGLGVGDVNGDGRSDVLTAMGWLEQPESLEDNPIWEPHLYEFCPGGAQMYAYDVDGDGDNDVITSLNAHAYGLSWFENSSAADGTIEFKPHTIMGAKPEDSPHGIAFSQLHAIALHDMDGDGLKDIITGKCYWAHNGHDPGARDPAVLYYFRLVRDEAGATFVPIKIDNASGVGRQVSIGDLNGDEKPDIVVANKKGLFAFTQKDSPAGQASHWPTLRAVDSQPLLSQVERLIQAMEYVGAPLPTDVVQSLEELTSNMSNEEITDHVQQHLDPHCLAGVAINEAGNMRTVVGSAPPKLLQEGWRTFLVKVVNQAGLTTALDVSSLNAGDKPGALESQVDERWMDVSMVDGRPMTPRLSGLGLEYRIIQVFSSEAGSQTASLEFRVSGAASEDPSLIAEWNFDDGLAGWETTMESEVSLEDGIATLTHPQQAVTAFQHTIPQPQPSGQLELRVWMGSPSNGAGAVFWSNGPLENGNIGQTTFSIKEGNPREYRIIVDAEKPLTGIRLIATHSSAIDWIRLSRPSERAKSPTALKMTFDCTPATSVTLRVRDEHGQPTTAAFLIQDEDGHVYPTKSKRLAPDFFFHSQVYRSDGEKLSLPPGQYTIRCSRGPESISRTRNLTVGEESQEFVYRVERWVDPASLGWYSGDHHIHAAGCAHYQNPTQGVHAIDMARHCMGEDLKVGCNLTWGPCFDYQKQFFTGEVAEASQYPYLLRYDVEVSGFGSHVSGHLCLLRLKDQIYPGGDSKDHWPTLGLNTLKWAKAQGAVCGPAHSSAGLKATEARVDGEDGPPLPGWDQLVFDPWKSTVNLPNHFIPAYDGIGANEFIVDITHNVPGPDGQLVPAVDFIAAMNTDRVAEWNMWYHTLNCGFRAKTSGETDFPCVTGDRVGIGRVYVKVKERLDYDDWCQGISEGRSYVSDGSAHLMDLTASHGNQRVALGENGGQLTLDKPGQVTLKLNAAVRKPGQKPIDIELIHNGYSVARQAIASDGNTETVTFNTQIERSGWLAIRAAASAHTNPIFVIVDNQPIRASVASAQWCLKGVDQCWSNKQKSYADDEQADAQAAYEHARNVYRQILSEARLVANAD